MTQALDSSTTGGLANTRINAERHALSGNKTNPVVLLKGCGYWQGIEVINASTGLPLTKDVDYVPLDLCSIPTKLAGIPVYSTILILSVNNISIDVSYSYPNKFEANSYITVPLNNLFNSLTGTSRKSWWTDIKNRPVLFNPIEHRHDITNAVGYEQLINTLDQLIKIIMLGDQVDHNELINYIDTQLNSHFVSVISDITEINNSTTEVLAALNNRLLNSTNAVNNLIVKLNTLINTKDYYISVNSGLASSVTDSEASANNWITNSIMY